MRASEPYQESHISFDSKVGYPKDDRLSESLTIDLGMREFLYDNVLSSNGIDSAVRLPPMMAICQKCQYAFRVQERKRARRQCPRCQGRNVVERTNKQYRLWIERQIGIIEVHQEGVATNPDQQAEIDNLMKEVGSLSSQLERVQSKLDKTQSQLQNKKEQLEKLRTATKVEKDALPYGLKTLFLENDRRNFSVMANLEWIAGRIRATGKRITREKARTFAKELMTEFPPTREEIKEKAGIPAYDI